MTNYPLFALLLDVWCVYAGAGRSLDVELDFYADRCRCVFLLALLLLSCVMYGETGRVTLKVSNFHSARERK